MYHDPLAAQTHDQPQPTRRQGVVAVIRCADLFLAIKRSQFVSAPGRICFPGGGIETGESETEALLRELHEELGIEDALPVRCLWRSTTARQVQLAWWLATLDDPRMQPNCAEVEQVYWLSAHQLLNEPALLESNRHFFSELNAGRIKIE